MLQQVVKTISPGVLGFVWSVYSITAGTGQEAGIPPFILKGLAADGFGERETAQNRLDGWARKEPERSIVLLLKESQEAEDPEIRSRCLAGLKALVLERDYRPDGFLGVRMEEIDVRLPLGGGEAKALKISLVIEDSAAAKAGITAGTVILGLGERKWKNAGMALEFTEAVRKTKPGTALSILVLDNGLLIRKEVKVGERPPKELDSGEQDLEKANEVAREKFFKRWLDKRVKPPR